MNKNPHKKSKVKKMRKIIHRVWRKSIIDDVYSYMTKNKHPNSYKVQNSYDKWPLEHFRNRKGQNSRKWRKILRHTIFKSWLLQVVS